MSSYTDATARAVFIEAGGDPANSGPLAAWAASVIGTDDMAAGVIVAEDGMILAHTRRSGRPVAASYVTSVADPDAHGEVVDLEAGMAAMRLRRLTGQGTIEVTYSQVCKGAGVHVRRRASRLAASEVRAARATLGMTQDALAERLGVRRDTVRDWESGKHPAPYGLAGDLARIATDRSAEIAALADRLARPLA